MNLSLKILLVSGKELYEKNGRPRRYHLSQFTEIGRERKNKMLVI